MKYIWEAEDIIPGRWVRNPNVTTVTGLYLIGYRMDKERDETHLISAADGMVNGASLEGFDKVGMALWLNEQGFIPVDSPV